MQKAEKILDAVEAELAEASSRLQDLNKMIAEYGPTSRRNWLGSEAVEVEKKIQSLMRVKAVILS